MGSGGDEEDDGEGGGDEEDGDALGGDWDIGVGEGEE